MTAQSRWLMIVLVVLGVLAIVAGGIYLAEPAKSLPSFLPGHEAGVKAHHHIRAYISIVVGIVLFVGAYMATRMGSRQSSMQS